MTDVPERIWALADRRKHWQEDKPGDGQHEWHWTEYTRTDLADARVAAAYEAAVDAAYTGDDWHDRDIEPAIRALTPDDAQAALDRIRAEAMAEGVRRGMEKAAEIAEKGDAERCSFCNFPRNNHPYRHPFKGGPPQNAASAIRAAMKEMK